MLPSFRNRLDVALCRDHIVVRHTAKGWRPIAALPQELRTVYDAGAPDWQAAITCLAQYLKDQSFSGADIAVTVCDAFVRYAHVPWSDKISGAEELATYARIQLENWCGPDVGEWDTQVDMEGFGKAGIACAMDPAFGVALREVCAENDLSLIALVPNFMQAYNRARLRIGDETLFAVAHAEACVAAVRKHGAWHSIRTIRLRDSSVEKLLNVLRREALLQELDEDHTVQLDLPGAEASQFSPASKVQLLSPHSASLPTSAAMLISEAA